jgi:nucleotide-binding universal stress UspA family protein
VIELKRVLCPVDLSELSARPLHYAGAIARWYDGRVLALHVVPAFEPVEVRAGALFDPVQFVYPVPRDQVLERLRETVTAAGVPLEDVDLLAEAGSAAATIVDQAVTTHADLVVMGTHGLSGFDRLVLGSVTEKVLRRAPCPVLTVPPHTASAPGVPLDSILCPVDFSPAALQALGFAVDLARRANASLTVLQVIEWLPDEEPREFGHFNVPEFRSQLLEQTEEQLDGLVAQQPRLERGVASRVSIGRAYREVLRAAGELDANLIVMGAQGRGGPALTALGSTTQQVVRAAACPVLTVHAPMIQA